MTTISGCINLGTTERRYQRGKRVLRVSGKVLRAYLNSRIL